MDYIEDDDIGDGGYMEDYPGHDDLLHPRRGERHPRGMVGPTDVTFSVFVDPLPNPGEVVILSVQGSLEQPREGVVMRPCDTGNGRLWTATVMLNPTAAQGPANLAGGLMSMLGGLSALGSRGGPAPLFEVTYALRSAAGQTLTEDKPQPEQGPLRQHYYHRTRLGSAASETAAEDAFPMFVHDEVHRLQSNTTTPREFLSRFLQLASAPFARRRRLLDRALEELITVHWGENAAPPHNVVLAIAATLGYFRRQASHGSGGFPLLEDHGEMALGSYSHSSAGPATEKEKEPPPSLIVCRWIVKHCPARGEVAEEEEQRHTRGRDRDGNLGSTHQFQRYSQMGVLQAAETLYIGEKTFEWLKLLNFLPEHALPPPINASQCGDEGERRKLTQSFAVTMQQVFDKFDKDRRELRRNVTDDRTQQQRAEQAVQVNVELFLRGLTAFCPSAEGLQALLQRVGSDLPPVVLETTIPMVFQRIRTLHFGKGDKQTLEAMIRQFNFMQTDECAMALLTNQHHPSEAFNAREIVEFVDRVTSTSQGVRPAGPQLQSAMRRWLMRYYGRPPDRSDRKEEKQSLTAMTTSEYQTQKEEIRNSIRGAIGGWHMVLALPCFKQEEETLRMILFELSQAYFFKDPDPLLVLDCMLDLEAEIKNSSSVRQLEVELQRIAIKSVRDAQDTSEVEHHEELLRLLFQKPTPLRFVIIEAFMGFKQAAVHLGAILTNEPIWTLLLSRPWVEARGISDHPLGTTQRNGINMLQKSAQRLNNGSIHLNILHTILNQQMVYEKLVTQVCEKPKTIPDSQAKINKFDQEYNQVRAYVKMFCPLAQIEASKLNELIDNIKENYATLELTAAVSKFEGLPVRPHLPWLYSLRSSEVFSKIWKEVAKPTDGSTAKLKQEYVVSQVIPKARTAWEQLAKSIETGAAVLKDIRWCVDLQWANVQHELELLEATAPKASKWVPRATEQTKAMRLAAKLREWAPSMLHLREVLEDLFVKDAADTTVEELKTVVKQYEHMWEMPIGSMIEQVDPFKATISLLSEPMQDYTITAAGHDQLLKWLIKHKSTDDFNRLIALCRPNTDDSLILAAIASLQQTRTFLAEALYAKPSSAPYANLRTFLQELASLHVDETVHSSLVSVQQSFDPMLELLTTHSRTPGAQACYDLKKISEFGTFHVMCSLKENEQLTCEVPDSVFNYEALAELRRQLLMTDVPEELDGAKNLPEMLTILVEKFKLLEEYGRCTMELFKLGHFAYNIGQHVLSIKPKTPVATVETHLKELQQKLEEWQNAVDSARGQHYFLNYFTVRELCYLVKEVPLIANDANWNNVWPLLRTVDLQANNAQTRKKAMSMLGPLKAAGSPEAAMTLLSALGELLSGVFQSAKPQVRPLEGLSVQQQLQGDLLIRSMQQKEQGVPVFVCCADEPSKVTELVLSIYTRRSRVPEAEELKLCSSHTTLEEIELLLRRFFFARKYHREDLLYCLGNVHLLPYVVQCGTVEALRRLEEKFGFGSASALVFVSGQQNQMLTNALSQHNLAVSVLPEDMLTEAVAKIGEKYHGRQLEAVAAPMNGVGKTHYILRQIEELQRQHGNQPVLHHVEVRETTDISSLVTCLMRDPTNPSLPTAIHIDLAHILPSHVDTLLFELLVVGMLRDTQQCVVYHRRAVDFFFVEMPNTPGEATAKQLSFCMILPRTFLRMNQERIDPDIPIMKTVNNAPMVEFKKNDALVLVGKTLAAMKVEAFNPKSKDFNVTWTAANTPAINVKNVYGLLEDVCSSETSPPSFLVFMNFVRFLGQLVKSAEEWNMMNLQLLQNFDPGLKHFKHCFFRLLIETSRDFALRQVPKAQDNIDTSPLAPPQAQNLVRALSHNNPPLPASLARQGSNMSTPGLERQRSRVAETERAQAAADLQEETGGVGRIEVSSYVRRFDQMPSWESCVHPIASFKKSENGTIIGCNIMSLQRDFLGNFIDRNLQNSLNLNDLKLEKDWSKVTHSEAVHLVHLTEGGELLKKKDYLSGPKDYVVTVDNLLKLMSIQQRLKYGLPVILMGETGCGKTALVKFLAKTLDFRLFTLDIHGGISDENITEFLDKALTEVDESRGVLVFFDEINAANCMALFKTIIIDRMYGNKQIPANCRIISCCNPYRLRKHGELEDVALVFQHHSQEQATGIQDPMKRLVYRVHPLPESLIDVVSDFGALSEKSEEIYVNAILRKELPNMDDAEGGAADAANEQSEYDMFVGAFKELLCQSQVFVREVNEGERSVVSMRDIARAARVFKWFLTYYSKLRGVSSLAVSDDKDGVMRINITQEMKPHLRTAVILTLGYCYHSRLNREQRWGYRKRLCDTWSRMRTENANMEWLKLDDAGALSTLLTETQYEFVSQMELGEGIALNEALRENLFMLLVSIMNQIPILLIGKPGCSKSLAMGVLQNNLNGEVSNKEFFKSMPAVEVFAYQCSPLSTPDAILSAFHSARQSNLGHKSTIVCVLLDEVGLAEESPHLPLKVLHRELEDLRGIACVGISNWALDAAKMSRCVTLYRPPPTVEDLCVTAEGMVASANLKGYLRALSEAFFEIYKTQKRADFWGMREFYSTVRVINTDLKLRASQGKDAVLEPQVLMKTVQRNFGGRHAEEMEMCIEEFFERTGMSFEQIPRYSTADLIQQNLLEPDARHLMLLTKNNAALRLLFESGLLDHNKAEVMFGSTFPNDQSDVFVAMNLQRIKSFMQQPISLVMVHCDSLYESLYDLLNQHYMEYAGQRYVRIAHGSKAKQCPIHKLFRVIVITEISDAYFRLAPPLLNRFEKQIFLRKDLMTRADEALLNKLTKFWELLVECMIEFKGVADAPDDNTQDPGQRGRAPRHKPIAGYHAELLSSLVFTLRRKHGSSKNNDELYDEAKQLLTWVLTPEAVCITAASYGRRAAQLNLKFGFDLVSAYFEEQNHSDLPSFAETLVKDKTNWCDAAGAQVMVMTYSPIRGKIGQELQKVVDGTPQEVSLHELSSSQDIEKVVHEFYASAPESKLVGTTPKRFLIIHADPVACSLRMIEHCRFVCEKARVDFIKKGKGAPGSMFVTLVVHLQRGVDGNFSFDFDSQWHFVFLDSVEPSMDLNRMPSLGSMLNMPLIEVVRGLEFPKLLKNCFRSSLSRLIYPHSRRPDDLHKQIQQILVYLDDQEFTDMVRNWVLRVLETTPKRSSKDARAAGSSADGDTVGQDKNWFAAIATDAHDLALAGTFRAALHNRIVVLISSLLTVLLAHLDRNGGLALLGASASKGATKAPRRQFWLSLSTASLTSPLSARLHNEAVTALREAATEQHEVGTDAYTGARPFISSFPASWFVSRTIDGVRHIIEGRPPQDQLSALISNYQLSKLHEVNLNPVLPNDLLNDYLSDFTAMHLDWTVRISREIQQRILKKMITRVLGKQLTSILEVHQLFWVSEKQIAYCIALLNAVPDAVEGAEKLIETVPLETLSLELLLLVHKTLTLELKDSKSTSDAHSFYREWLTRKMVVSGHTKDFIVNFGGTSAPEKLMQLKTDTEPRIETLALLLQHVAYPMHLPLDIVSQFLKDLPQGKVRHSKSLCAILQLAARIAEKEGALPKCSSFIESWILDVCLRDAAAISDLDESCLRLVCSVAAGLPVVIEPNTVHGVAAGSLSNWNEQQDCGIATLPGKTAAIPRSSCLNLALLRKLIVASEGEAKKVATRKIEELLKEISTHEKHNDTTFATRYAVLCEEDACLKMQELAGPEEWPLLSLRDIFMARGDQPAGMLQDVGKIRWILTKYAAVLCKEPINLTEHAACVPKVDPLLQTSEDALASVCRSMRLYLLKCIERSRGISYLRGLLAEPPLSDTRWVSKWRDMHDIDFEKFIGAALVPKWNPFAGEDGTAEYREAKIAVFEMMTSTATEKLDRFAQECSKKTPYQQKRDIGGLMMALCQEPGLLAALEDMDRRPPWRSKLNWWLKTCEHLPVSDKERTLLRIFAGDETAVHCTPAADREHLMPFVISGGSTGPKMDDILRWRVLGHLASVLVSSSTSSVLATLRKLMLQPVELTEGAPPFLPGMDEDIRNRVMKALLERGENIWKFKSHWYKCTCGYTFFIGECGRPMEVAACPGCSVQIGGKDHTKTTHTTEDDENDRSPAGYMLPRADKDEKHVSFREVPASSARAIRLILHGAMFCGIASVAGPTVPRIFDQLVNPDSMCSMLQEPEAKYIGDHFSNDWKQLVDLLSSNVEDLAATMHNLLRCMSIEMRDEPKAGSAFASQNQASSSTAAAGSEAQAVNWEKLSLSMRHSWEETAEAKYLTNLVKINEAAQDLYKRWGGAAEDGKFVAELKEAADVRDFPRQKREAEMPQLWAFRSAVTLDALHKHLGLQKNASEAMPVLCTVLQQPLFPVLKALGMLVGVFEWHSLVINHFSGRITRTEAGNLRVGEVLDGLPPTDRQKWERAFEQFQQAWHIAWPYVDRYECQGFSENLKQVMVNRSSEILWCIAEGKDEGLVPLAITQWLVERHNELVQVVSASMGYPARKVSSRLLGQHDVIVYDEADLMRFLRSRCVTYGVGGKLNFDFRLLENHLGRELSRPEITMELRGFQWLGESFAGSNELKQVIKQKDLMPDTIERLRAELASPSVAHNCLQKVQMSISFILKSGGGLSTEHAGEMLLSEYLRSVLSESPDSLPSATARSQVHLWHVDSFVKMLKQIINKDPMDAIDPKYKADLPQDFEAAVKSVKSRMPDVLVEVLGSFAETRLAETYIGEEVPLMDCLSQVLQDHEVSSEAMDTIAGGLPSGLQMKHWAALYRVLKAR